MSLPAKIKYALANPDYLIRRVVGPIYAHTGYDQGQWARAAMYSVLFDEVAALGCDLSVLEISPGGANSPWRALRYREYVGADYPDFDICHDRLDRQFDLIIADQVFEHLLWPYRAARNVHAMLKPGGHFINTAPFLIRVHENPVDCSRWTELGMKHLLAEAGFDIDRIRTGSWGNLACVRANLVSSGWARIGWGRSMRNQSRFPVAVWAIAKR
jgi:SAM-dependent methyltransferase